MQFSYSQEKKKIVCTKMKSENIGRKKRGGGGQSKLGVASEGPDDARMSGRTSEESLFKTQISRQNIIQLLKYLMLHFFYLQNFGRFGVFTFLHYYEFLKEEIVDGSLV